MKRPKWLGSEVANLTEAVLKGFFNITAHTRQLLLKQEHSFNANNQVEVGNRKSLRISDANSVGALKQHGRCTDYIPSRLLSLFSIESMLLSIEIGEV